MYIVQYIMYTLKPKQSSYFVESLTLVALIEPYWSLSLDNSQYIANVKSGVNRKLVLLLP